MSARGTQRGSAALVLLLVALLLVGCGSGTKAYVAPGYPLRDRPKVAMLPLEDLTGRGEVASKITHIFFVELVRTGICDLAEMGESENAVRKNRIRSTGSLSNDQIDALAENLGVGFLMTGTVLEAGTIRTDRGEVPALGVTLKLIEVATKKVIWADVANRTGDDNETVFGWGREHSSEQLAIEVAKDMFESLAELAPPPAKGNEGGQT